MTDVNLPPKARSLIDRAKGLLLKPKEEWDEIAAEPATFPGLFTGYVLLLAAIPAVAIFLGLTVFNSFPINWSLSAGVSVYVASLVAVLALGFALEFLGPQFGAKPDRVSAFKLAAYSMTPFWVAGVLFLLPSLAPLVGLAGLYGVYLLYLGLPKLAPAEGDKAQTWTIVAVVAALIALAIAAGSGQSSFVFRVADNSAAPPAVMVPGYGSVNVAKAEAASRAADAAIASALAQGSGAATVQPVAAEALTALLPGAIGGFARGEVTATSAGAAGLNTAAAKATYSRGEAAFDLAVTDMGGAAAFAQLGAAFDLNHAESTGGRYEKVGKVAGRLTMEKYDASARTGEYSVVVAERFMVEASGRNVDMTALKTAVGSVGFSRLEAMARGA